MIYWQYFGTALALQYSAICCKEAASSMFREHTMAHTGAAKDPSQLTSTTPLLHQKIFFWWWVSRCMVVSGVERKVGCTIENRVSSCTPQLGTHPQKSPNHPKSCIHSRFHTRGLHNDASLSSFTLKWQSCQSKSVCGPKFWHGGGWDACWLYGLGPYYQPVHIEKISKHSQCKGQGTVQDAPSICTPWKYSPPRPPRLIKMQEAPRNQGVPAPHLPIRLGPPNGDDDWGGFLHRPGASLHGSSWIPKRWLLFSITTFWQSFWPKFV